MASPHAAGVAALIIGQNGGEMAPAQVEAARAITLKTSESQAMTTSTVVGAFTPVTIHNLEN